MSNNRRPTAGRYHLRLASFLLVDSISQRRVCRNIVGVARSFRLQRLWDIPDLLVLSVCRQESDWDDTALGDNGESYSVFQIYQIAHPNTWQRALDPWSNYAADVIYQQWQKTWLDMNGPTVWQSIIGRGSFIERFAPEAQGSVSWPVGNGDLHYAASVSMLEMIS